MRYRLFPLVVLLGFAPVAAAQDAVRLVEKFDPATPYRVDLKVTMTGRLTLPAGKDQPATEVAVEGTSTLAYDERPLASDEPNTDMPPATNTDFRGVIFVLLAALALFAILVLEMIFHPPPQDGGPEADASGNMSGWGSH